MTIPRWANPAAFALFAGFLIVETTSRLVRTGRFDEDSLGDFLINLSFTWRTLETGAFPADFYYPLPFILFYDALGAFGVAPGALFWFAGIVAAGLSCGALLIRLDGWRDHGLRWPAVVLAVLASIYFVQWDLRTGNSNLIYLALLLGSVACVRATRPRPGWAGALLALSISLKLYSILWLPYLVWTRRWLWLLWSLVWLTFCFVALPALVLGPTTAFELTQAWGVKLLTIPDPALLPDFYKSLTRSLLTVLADDWGSPAVRAMALVWKIAWVGMLGCYFFRAEKLRGPGAPRKLLLLDASVLMLLPLPFSPTFQAHHAAVTLLPTFLLVGVAADSADAPRRRSVAVAFLLTAGAVIKFAPPWPARGIAIMLSLAVTALALVWMLFLLKPQEARDPLPA